MTKYDDDSGCEGCIWEDSPIDNEYCDYCIRLNDGGQNRYLSDNYEKE